MGTRHFTACFHRRRSNLGAVLLVWATLFGGNGPNTCAAQWDSLLNVWHDEGLDLDSRLTAFDDLYQQFHQQYPDTILHELEMLANLSKNRPLILFEAWLRKGGVLNYQGKNAESLEAYQRAEAVILPLQDTLRMGALAANRANTYAGMANYPKAMDCFMQALEWYQRVHHAPGVQRVRMAIGNVFVLVEAFDLGKEQYNTLLEEVAGNPENDRLLGQLSMNLGYCEYKLGHFDQASDWYLKSIPLIQQAQSDFHLASCYQNLAVLRMDEAKVGEARDYAQQSVELFNKLGAREYQLESELLLARLLVNTDAGMALQLAKPIYEQVSVIRANTTKRDLYQLLYQAQKQLGNVGEALEMHERYLVYHDSVEQTRHQYLVIRTAYEKDTEHRMNLLQLENQEAMDRAYIRQLQQLIGLMLLFAVVLAMLLLYIRRSKKQHEVRKKALLKEIEALKAARMRNMELATPSITEQREHIESAIGRELNETDWKVLGILLDEPTITNQGIADRAFMSIDGIGSSLRRMYIYFNVKETKYKKIALVHAVAEVALKLSQKDSMK